MIGDTVNTTSRVNSKSKDGDISISKEVYDGIKLTTPWKYNPREVDAKGKGKLTIYQVS